MFDTSTLVVYITATLTFLLVPGPAIIFVVTRSLEQGRTAGLVSAFGIALSSVAHVIFAAFGLFALLMQSALVFSFVKYLGAIYLIYLGVRTLMNKAEVSNIREVKAKKNAQIFSQGFVVNLLNPKTALFFLAFLPQFIDPSRASVVLQILALGMIFTLISTVTDSLYALVAGTARQALAGSLRAARVQKYLAGTTYITLGIATALSGSRSK